MIMREIFRIRISSHQSVKTQCPFLEYSAQIADEYESYTLIGLSWIKTKGLKRHALHGTLFENKYMQTYIHST